MAEYSQQLYATAALVSVLLFGFLTAVIYLRIHGEAEAAAAGAKPSLAWADAIMVYVGLPALAVGGLLLPLAGMLLRADGLERLVVALAGFGILLAAFYPIALVWHHQLSMVTQRTGDRPNPTTGEAFMVLVSVLVAATWAALTLR